METVLRPDGAEIAWYDEGSGSPVLLVMGLAYPAAAWHRQVPVLAQHHRVLTVDNRGTGGSAFAPGAPYTVEQMAGDLLAVLDAAGEQKAHLVGISMGGLMAQQLALECPQRWMSLTLMATHPGLANAVFPPEVLSFVFESRTTMTVEQAREASIPYNYAPETPRAEIERDWAVRAAGSALPEAYTAQSTGTATWSRFEELGGIATPTQVLHGAQDRLVVRENADLVAGRIPDAKLVLVDGANHLLTTDRADEVNRLLLEWFAEHEG